MSRNLATTNCIFFKNLHVNIFSANRADILYDNIKQQKIMILIKDTGKV